MTSLTDRLTRAVLLHKRALSTPPDLRGAAILLDLIDFAESAKIPEAEADEMIVGALRRGAAVAKDAARVGCASAGLHSYDAAAFAPLVLREAVLERHRAQEGVEEVRRAVDEIDSAAPDRIHIILKGFALCGANTPRDWPQGEGVRWMRVEDATFANCDGCIEALDRRTQVALHPLGRATDPTLVPAKPQWWMPDADGNPVLTDATAGVAPMEPMLAFVEEHATVTPTDLDPDEREWRADQARRDAESRLRAAQEDPRLGGYGPESQPPALAPSLDADANILNAAGALVQSVRAAVGERLAEQAHRMWHGDGIEPEPASSGPGFLGTVLDDPAPPEPKLRRPRCPLHCVDANGDMVPCGRPADHKGDCGPAKPRKVGA